MTSTKTMNSSENQGASSPLSGIAGSISDFSAIPKGLYLCRMLHERTGKHCLHIGLKLHDAPWYDQPSVPVYAEEITSATCAEFWEWAAKNMPIYEYPRPVKSAM